MSKPYQKSAHTFNRNTSWTGEIDVEFLAGLKVVADNYEGLTADVISEVSFMHLSITQINARITKEKTAEIELRALLNIKSLSPLPQNTGTPSSAKALQPKTWS